ncbi:hypothetical protein BSKO_07457 [Bryopsis sp. KO-2023]|nr:hypothetical protein BSKO_07457 [Bryopsis sp. KO-2023]
MLRKDRTLYYGAAVASLSSLYAWWYFTKACCPPRVFVSEGRLKELLKTGVPNLWKPYRPTPWLVFSHLQTVAGVIRRIGGNVYERELLRFADGGTVGLDWFKDSANSSKWGPETPIVLVLHGLTGGSQEGYCRWMCTAARNHGWRSVVFNYRGCNGVPHTSHKGYCVTETEDLEAVVNHIKRRFSAAPLFVASYSLGSLMLCKYLGDSDARIKSGGPGSQVEAAGLVSCPCCMHSNQENIEKPWSIPYLFNLILAYRLKQYAKENKEQYGPHPRVDEDTVSQVRTLRDFEEATIVQVYDLPSIAEYRDMGSSRNHIPSIQTNSLILVSEDDPFIGDLPYAEALLNPMTALAKTSRGGHVAFLQGLWPFGQAWMEDTLMQFFESAHKEWLAKKKTAEQHLLFPKPAKILSAL